MGPTSAGTGGLGRSGEGRRGRAPGWPRRLPCRPEALAPPRPVMLVLALDGLAGVAVPQWSPVVRRGAVDGLR